MNVNELKAELDKYPGDMELALVGDHRGDLDTDVCLDFALQYASGSYDGAGASWRWIDDGAVVTPGESVCLVIY